jgi:hypothetical protein
VSNVKDGEREGKRMRGKIERGSWQWERERERRRRRRRKRCNKMKLGILVNKLIGVFY